MSDYAGLEKLTPSIIKYPFQKIINAFINIKLGRRIALSICTILAGLLGIAVGYIFPGIGAFMSFILNLFMETPVNSAVLSGISMVVSMLLAASLLIFITRDIFKSYYTSKYGIPNPELRLTVQDREMLTLEYTEDGFTPAEIKEKLNELELRIEFLLDKIRFFKMTGEDDKKRSAKYALHDLKRGDMSVFLDLYEDVFIKKQQRLEKLRKKPVDTNTKETETELRSTLVDAGTDDDSEYDYQDYQDEDAVSAMGAEEETKPKSTSEKSKDGKSGGGMVIRDSQNSTVSLVVNLYGVKKDQVEVERQENIAPAIVGNDESYDDGRVIMSSPS